MKLFASFLAISCFIFLVSLSSVDARPLTAPANNEAWHLRKLSIHLRGFNAAPEEFVALSKITDSQQLKLFFESKTKEYIATPFFVAQMNERLDALFRFKSINAPTEYIFTNLLTEEPIIGDQARSLIADYSFYPPTQLGAADGVFRKLTQQNLAWDALLLESEYHTSPLVSEQQPASFKSGSSADLRFFSTLISEGDFLLSEVVKMGKVTLTPKVTEDPRLAGSITTHRFLSRYVNTITNKNRRRAAAIFNLFLCDEMRPVSVPDESEDMRFVEQSLRLNATPHTQTLASLESRHATDQACATCHDKLDPLASLFTGFGDALPAEVTEGALIYKIKATSTQAEHSVNIPVKGFRELSKAIVSQPEYASCQVKHFWKWFIGSDVYLPEARENELVALFNSTGRKTNDFVAALVNQPEFYTPPAVVPVTVQSFRKVEKHLQNCAACHGNGHGPSVDLAKFPIGGTDALNLFWLKKIARTLDLKNDGKNAKMPPPEAAWDQSYIEEVISETRAWFCMGAPDSTGTLMAKEFGATLCK